MIKFFLLISIFLSIQLINTLVIDQNSILDDLDDSLIISKSRNFTVHSNDTVQLSCMVRKSPNTIVIWNQCDDPNCNQLRNPLTVNKENFIEDLRFRVLSENPNTNTFSSTVKNNQQQQQQQQEINNQEQNELNSFNLNNQIASKTSVNSWNLEIRRFSKNDEACYQCQLNSFKVQTIHYCLKLQTKVTAKSRRISVLVNEPIKLKCHSDESVKLSSIKWFRNGHKIADDSSNNDLIIEKRIHNDNLYTTLYIKKSSLNDAGTYLCKFGNLHDKIHVDVIMAENSPKARLAESKSVNKEVESNYLSMSPSLANTIFGFSKFSLVFYIYLLLIIIFSIFNKYT